MVPQATLVTAQSFGKTVRRRIECGIGFVCLPLGFQMYAAAYMSRYHCAIQMRIPRKRYDNLDRIPEVLVENSSEGFINVRSQRVTDVQLLSLNGELHNRFYGLKRGG
jgi:hypothetical protein